MSLNFDLFDSLLEPCFILNGELKVVYANETAITATGLTKRKVLKAKFDEILMFSEPIDWIANIQAVTEAAPYKEVFFKTQDESAEGGKVQITCRPYSAPGAAPTGAESPAPAGEAGGPLWIVFVRDVTLEERLQKKYRKEFEAKETYIVELQNAQKELENYSKNLEKMVEERTAEVRALNGLMSGLLDSLAQGFFIFDQNGQCLNFSSKACETVLEKKPNNQPVWEVLGLPAHQVEGFKKWTTTLFADMLPFEDLAPLGPAQYPHSQGKHIQLEYFPLMGEAGITGVITVATDITNLVQAQKEAAYEREKAKMVMNLVQRKESFLRFTQDTNPLLAELKKIMPTPYTSWDLDEVFRLLHTLKGGFGVFNVFEAAQVTHEAEEILSEMRTNPSPELAARLVEKSKLMDSHYSAFLGEARSIVGEAYFKLQRTIEIELAELESFCVELSRIPAAQKNAAEFYQQHVMMPVGAFFKDYDVVAQNLAEKLGKKIEPLAFKNDSLPILPERYADLFSTLIHSYRNSMDHGIENPEDRVAKNKSEYGRIETRFRRENGQFIIEIQDDGAGIDPARIRAKLAKNGVNADGETDDQVIQHVFDASFSTKEVVTDVSGRGVGMDAIKHAAIKLGGSVVIESKRDQGTKLTIKVPDQNGVLAPLKVA